MQNVSLIPVSVQYRADLFMPGAGCPTHSRSVRMSGSNLINGIPLNFWFSFY